MAAISYKQAKFLTSVAQLSQLPPDEGKEVAFIGRSNAGKSSALNALTQQHNLARTSKTPGRTQCINFFTLDEQRKIVDLPGYGYAKVPESVKERWQSTLHLYLTQRRCLKGLILLMDIRHPLKPLDLDILNLAHIAQLPVHILLTKADKLGYGAARTILQKTRSTLDKQNYSDVTLQLFSVTQKQGLEELTAKFDQWLNC